MGQDALCRIEHNGELHHGKALLETSEIIVRGDFRLKIPFASISNVTANDGRLYITWSGGNTIIYLGAQSARWTEKIKNPPTLMYKLGVKPGCLVRVEGVQDEEFDKLLDSSGAIRSNSDPLDLVFYEADGPDDLEQLTELKQRIKPNGGIWVISPRGRKEIQDIHVIAAAKSAGLVDVKVCRFSETHTALKLVIPKDKR